MKKFSALILGSMLALSLSSCTESQPDPTPSIEQTPIETTAEPTTEDPAVFDKIAEDTAKSYIKTVVDEHSALSAAKLMFPKDIALKSFTTEDIAREKLFDGMEMDTGAKTGDFRTDKCVPLSESQLKDAEAFYEKYANVISGLPKMDYTVVNGREITFTVALESGDDSQDYTATYVIVDMGDEGYKVINTTASKLEGLAD
ncbi:hypothetical protein [Ruminococcus flavefaciens]|uniref:hypothetical protein n=1 Tax=Ruminococcus flavefaciens TaxID=1265 RepID=UPI000463C1FD|nr:hypothetical protein [Ruminococcus flavefaciens]